MTTTSAPRRALVTGIGGQDGGYLAEQLKAEGVEVWGLVRGREGAARARELPWLSGVTLVEGDLADGRSLRRAIECAEPEEIYNLGSYSQTSRAWSEAEASALVNAIGPLRLLEAIVASGAPIRMCQASTSEMFGADEPNPQNEQTPLRPRSPYGSAKAFAHQLVGHYRKHYGLFACGAVLYNHESPRRGEGFVTRKISRAAARIKLGRQSTLALGSTDAGRDWGYAPDHMRALRLMMRAARPDDYLVGTGVGHSVREFVEIAFAHLDLDPERHLIPDPELARNADTVCLLADASKARRELGWEPTVSFNNLVVLMVEADLVRERAAGAAED